MWNYFNLNEIFLHLSPENTAFWWIRIVLCNPYLRTMANTSHNMLIHTYPVGFRVCMMSNFLPHSPLHPWWGVCCPSSLLVRGAWRRPALRCAPSDGLPHTGSPPSDRRRCLFPSTNTRNNTKIKGSSFEHGDYRAATFITRVHGWECGLCGPFWWPPAGSLSPPHPVACSYSWNTTSVPWYCRCTPAWNIWTLEKGKEGQHKWMLLTFAVLTG